jgi:hypothetical protein
MGKIIQYFRKRYQWKTAITQYTNKYFTYYEQNNKCKMRLIILLITIRGVSRRRCTHRLKPRFPAIVFDICAFLSNPYQLKRY